MNEDLFQNLGTAILNCNKKIAETSAKKIIDEKLDSLKALDVMTVAVRQVGEGFAKGELWLPDLVGAGDAMSAAVAILEQDIKILAKNKKTLGTVVLGTVSGDIHTIGKTMVGTLLVAEGFTVHDLGIDVSAEIFVDAVKKYKADILAMSALLTTTALEQKKTIELLKKNGLRDSVKVMVGGGAITRKFAEEIGADGYDPTAPGAAKTARSLLQK